MSLLFKISAGPSAVVSVWDEISSSSKSTVFLKAVALAHRRELVAAGIEENQFLSACCS